MRYVTPSALFAVGTPGEGGGHFHPDGDELVAPAPAVDRGEALPAGIDNGQAISLRGQGGAGVNGGPMRPVP